MLVGMHHTDKGGGGIENAQFHACLKFFRSFNAHNLQDYHLIEVSECSVATRFSCGPCGPEQLINPRRKT